MLSWVFVEVMFQAAGVSGVSCAKVNRGDDRFIPFLTDGSFLVLLLFLCHQNPMSLKCAARLKNFNKKVNKCKIIVI